MAGTAWTLASIEEKFNISEANFHTLLTEYSWSTRTITYSFPAAAFPGADSYIPDGETLQYTPFSQVEIDFVHSAFDQLERTINLDFVYDASGAGEMKFGHHNMTVGGYAAYPYPGSLHEILIANNLTVGRHSQFVFWHELGHSLGLEHTHESDTPLPSQYDTGYASVMSYEDTYGPIGSYMLLDVLALIEKYGKSTLATDDTYSADLNAIVIADFGGNDVIDLSTAEYKPGTSTAVDLVRGFASFDVKGGSPDFAMNSGNYNMIIADGTTIEKVIGSSIADKITGGAGNEELIGNEGDDQISGGAGIDNIDGGNGNDVLDGGAGADVMRGGWWHDTFYVDDVDDEVIELGGEGVDRVIASVDYTLHNFIEVLVLAGTAISGSGDDQKNTIIGNQLDNILIGGLGKDTLSGRLGSDVFRFVTKEEAGRGKKADSIIDFDVGEDAIDISGLADIGSLTFIGASAFHRSAGEVRYVTINQRGKKEDATLVEGDLDGNGKSDFELRLVGLHSLADTDFIL